MERLKNIALLVAFIFLFIGKSAYAEFDGSTVGTVILQVSTAAAGSVLEADASAAEDGDPIADWTDQSGAGNHLITGDGSSGARLVYDIDGIDGAFPCAQGASGDFMNIANTSMIRNLSAITLMWYGRWEDSGTTQGIFDAFTPSFSNRYGVYVTSTDLLTQRIRNPDATDNEQYSTVTLNDNTTYSIATVLNLSGGVGERYTNGTSNTNWTLSGTSNMTDSATGAQPTVFGTENYTNTFRGCTGALYIWSTALSDAQIATAHAGIVADFSATPTPTPTPTPPPGTTTGLLTLTGVGS